VAGPFSPMGTGSIVMSAGSFGGSRSGTYSQLNLRNNTGGDTMIGNDVEVTGTGLVNFGPASTGEQAPAGSRIIMGNLQIGGGQIAAVNKNGPISQIVQFSSVTLTGGDATFSPKTPAFGFGASSDLALGPIGESAPGSGIIMDGEAGLFLLGGNTYTGTTRIQRGTTWLAGAGALPATSALHVEAGMVDFQNGSGVSFSQTVGALSGAAGGIITNSASDATRDFVINQASDTMFEGSITGSLNVVKQGVGTLQLVGANAYSGTTTVAGGTLSVSSTFLQGSITGPVTVQSGASLTGYGSVGALTVTGGGRVAPGNSPGVLTTGAVTLQADAVLEFEFNGTVTGSQYDQLEAFGLVTLEGLVQLVLDLGFDPADHVDTFTLILNNDLGPIAGAGRFVYGADVLENGDQFEVTSAFFSQLFEIRYNGGNDNNDVVLLAVPEPSSALLMLGGLGVLARRRRRR
jgi:autotransporter-associated beta strand protein